MSHATQLCPNPGTTPDIDVKIEVFLLRWDNQQTRNAYRAAIHCWADWCAARGLDPIHGIHRTHVEAWVLELKDSRKLKPTTINHRVTVLRIWFELAIDDGLIARNPCRLVRKLRVPRDNTRKSLHRNELRQLLIAARDDRPGYYALVVLMAYCGLRVSEAVGLDVEDTRVTEHSHRCARVTRKGGEVALIPMPPVVQRAVDEAAGDRTSGPLIVGVLSGERISRRCANEVIKRLARKAGIEPEVSSHWLRHTFTVTALAGGIDPQVVQESLGHAELSTTLKWYNRARFSLDDHAAYAVAGTVGSVA